MSFKVILNFKNVLRLIKINKIIENNKDVTFNDYNNNIIIINIIKR